MIRWSPPDANALDEVRRNAATAQPTHRSTDALRGFEIERQVGFGRNDFAAGKDALRNWQMHRGAGVNVETVPLAIGNDVVMWTRVLVPHVVFACRITEVFDDDDTFGFSYATLPGHPERGSETFKLEMIDGAVMLRITGASRPALVLNKLSGPIGPMLQRRFLDGYIEAMRQAIATATTGG